MNALNVSPYNCVAQFQYLKVCSDLSIIKNYMDAINYLSKVLLFSQVKKLFGFHKIGVKLVLSGEYQKKIDFSQSNYQVY